jgi:hypothetical protein
MVGRGRKGLTQWSIEIEQQIEELKKAVTDLQAKLALVQAPVKTEAS